MVSKKDVLNALGNVLDPELKKDLVSLNMIRDLDINAATVKFKLVLTTPACPLKREIEDSVRAAVEKVDGVEKVAIETTAEVPSSKALPQKAPIPGVKNTIAVASGKGGVGKSTVAVNLALALSMKGAKVGIIDSDVYGPSIPMMLGVQERLKSGYNDKIIPIEKNGLKIVSMGFMLDDDTPLIWRGPMVMQVVKQFLRDVEWGELDYLVIDLPPGTGDAQLTLVQTIPLSGVVVTTPQDVALIDAFRAIKMFRELSVPVLGIVENMSFFLCPHCGESSEVFSRGGGEKASKKYNVPLLGKIPLDSDVMEGGDKGSPILLSKEDSFPSNAFLKIAESVAARLSVINLQDWPFKDEVTEKPQHP